MRGESLAREADRRQERRILCMNSGERAYQVPWSTLAQVWSRLTGSRLRKTRSARPMLIARKAKAHRDASPDVA